PATATGHHLAEQADRLRQRTSRGWLPAGSRAGAAAQPLGGRRVEAAVWSTATQGARPRGTAGYRLHRPLGADAGRPHRATADRRRQRDGEGIPGASELRQLHERRPARFSASAVSATAAWPESGWAGAQAGAGGLAEPRAVALRAHRGQEAPDPAHVRAGRAEGGRTQASPDRARGAGAAAGGAVAVYWGQRTILANLTRVTSLRR